MKIPLLKLAIALFILFLLDLIRPLGYSLAIEFLFLGVIFVSLNAELSVAIFLSIFFGYLRDCLTPNTAVLSAIEFPLLCLLVHYLLAHILFARKKRYTATIRKLIVAIAIVTHLILNSIYGKRFLHLLSLQFFIQSLAVYFFVDYLLRNWMEHHSPSASRPH